MALRDRITEASGARQGAADLITTYLDRLLSELNRDELAGLSDAQRRARLERRMGEILSL